MAMTPSQLLLTDEALAALTEALVTAGHPTALQDAIDEREQWVTARAARYAVPDSTLHRLVRALALWDLYTLVGQVSEATRKSYEAANAELDAIQSGKVYLPVAPTAPSVPSGGAAWGSTTKI
jgi:phage gp36-like protein